MDSKEFTEIEYARMYTENLTLKTCLLQAQNACMEMLEKFRVLEAKYKELEEKAWKYDELCK